ncbi:MAG: class I SAM-dependent methyltransferase [Patescibacteria group bacterium]
MKQSHSTYHTLALLNGLTEEVLKNKILRPAFRVTLLQLRKDIKAALSFWENNKRSLKLSENRSSLSSDKLQIGVGKHYLSGFVNLDLFPPADIIWDCRYGLPFPNGTFGLIFSEHFFEHLDFPISAKKVLSEIYRALKPGGELFLGVPDAGKAIRAYCSGNKLFLNNLRHRVYKKRYHPPLEIYGNIDLINYLFRDQLDSPKYTIHYWAYDEDSLTNLLRSVGFRVVEKTKFNFRYCNPERKFYTLYIKATK